MKRTKKRESGVFGRRIDLFPGPTVPEKSEGFDD